MKFSSTSLFALVIAVLADSIQADYEADIKEWATSGCPTRDNPHHWWPKATLNDNEVLCAGVYDTRQQGNTACRENGGRVTTGTDVERHGDIWCAWPRNDPIIDGKPACPAPYHYGGVKNGKMQCHATWTAKYGERWWRNLCEGKGGKWIILNYRYNPYTCEMGELPTPTANGDPHFVTWSGEKFDFHGGCDLVLLTHPDFSNGLGLNIHIRTQIKTWWSSIESAVLQIGDNTLQITGGTGKSSYSTNGAESTQLVTGDATLGDFAVAFTLVNDHHTKSRVDLGNGDAIGIETFKDFVRVNVKNVKNTNFDGALGMLGSYPSGQKVGRDGKTVFEDANEFGQEWMVNANDTILFPDTTVGDLPLMCAMPKDNTAEKSRRLGEGITEEEAALACARVDDFNRDACIFDVLATNDKDMAGSY